MRMGEQKENKKNRMYCRKIGGRIVSVVLSFALIFGSIDLHVFAEELMSEEVMQTESEIVEESSSLSEEESSEEEVSEETVSEEISEESTEEEMTSKEETASEETASEEGETENTEESASEEKETEVESEMDIESETEIVRDDKISNTSSGGSYIIPDTDIILNFRIEEKGIIIIGCEQKIEGVLEIPEKINGIEVIAIGERAFQQQNIEGIIFPDSIRYLEERAFNECRRLKSIKWSENLEFIGRRCFAFCDYLKEIVLPKSLKNIEGNTFYACSQLKSVVLPEGIPSIPGAMFNECPNLESVYIPSSVEEIEQYAFAYCKKLSFINLPDKIKKIGKNAFYKCTSLGNINIPDGVIQIDDYAFYGCMNLENDKLPLSLQNIGAYAFEGCSLKNLKELPQGLITIGNNAFHGCKFSEMILPETVKNIGEGAFEVCSNLTKIVLPNGIERIENNTFYNCSVLSEVVLPESLENIEEFAFYGCTNLSSIKFPKKLKRIEGNAFMNCKKLKNVIFSSNLSYIAQYAFAYCIALESISIPKSLKTIAEYVFNGCYEIKNIYYEGNEEEWKSVYIGWDDGSSVKSAVVHFKTYPGIKQEFEGHQYLLVNEDMTWTEAKEYCEKEGGHLVTINSVEEQKFLEDLLFEYYGVKNGEGGCWLGGTYETEWKWITGETFSFQNWSYGEPNGNANEPYLIMNKNGKWNDGRRGVFLTICEWGEEKKEDTDSELDKEIFEEVKKYTADELYAQWDVIMNSKFSNEEKLRRLSELFINYGITDVREGVQYISEVSAHRRNFLYVVTNENFCSYNWWYWLNMTTKGKIARGLLYTSGLIFNFELATYIDWSTYANGTFPGVEKNKTVLKEFMEGREKDLASITEIAKKMANSIDQIIEINSIVKDAKMDEILAKLISAGTEEEIDKYIKEFIEYFIKEVRIQQEIEVNGELKLYLGTESIAKVLDYTMPIMECIDATTSDIYELIKLEENASQYEKYDQFLKTIYMDYDVSKEMRIAAYQIHEEIEKNYFNKIRSILSNFIKVGIDVMYVDKGLLKTYLESQGLSSVSTDMIGEAIGTLTLATVISNIVIDMGDFVKQAAYTSAYAELATLYSIKLYEAMAVFRENPTVENAWKFYEDYNILWRLRKNGEMQYLEMNSIKSFIFAEIKTKDYTYKERVVEEVLECLDGCRFDMASETVLPNSTEYQKKMVIKCPVDVMIYTANGELVAELHDGVEVNLENEYGNFAVVYEPYSNEYAKVICQSTDEKLDIRIVAIEQGIVNCEFANSYGNSIFSFDNLSVQKGDIISITDNEYNLVSSNGNEVKKGTFNEISRYIKPNQINIEQNQIEMVKNEKVLARVSILPKDAFNKDIIWYSENEEIVSVQNGVIKANGVGEACVWAKCCDNNEVEDFVAVKVINDLTEEKINILFDSQGGKEVGKLEGIEPNTTIELPDTYRENYLFKGWYTEPNGGGIKYTNDTMITESIVLYAYWIPANLWISEISPQTYTGTSVKPIVEVYDGEILLTEKVDYTISYKNNVKVNDASEEKTAPTITVTGRGNYTGKETATFQIVPKDIGSEDILVDDIVLKYNKKVQKSIPVVIRDGKKLGYKKDFIIEYPELENNSSAYKEPGEYAIIVKGIGGYSGERTITQYITAGTLMSKVSVGKIVDQKYTGQALEPAVTVKYGKDVLVQDKDYSVIYENNTEIGTAKVILNGRGEYAGTKEVTFKIIGESLSKAKVTGLVSTLPYTGEEQYQNCTLTMMVNKTPVVLVENEDYVVSYQKNRNVGTAIILFAGINGYSGTIKKSFRITPFDIKADGMKEKEERLFEIEQGMVQPYAKGGAKPKPVVVFNGAVLEENVDYTLSYKNNTSVNDGSNPKKLPTVSVTGKGNFKGGRSESFVIIPQEIKEVAITVSDKVYQPKKNAWKPTVVLTDVDGKRLLVGKDYEKNLSYTYAEDTVLMDGTKRWLGDTVEPADIPMAGTSLRVAAIGTGNYTGTVSGICRIVKSDIAKARVVIPDQIYTGKEIKPGKDQIRLSIGKEELKSEDYEIIGYSNNVKKGSASIVLKGMGNYGGTKTVKFTIKAKGILWWWRELFH